MNTIDLTNLELFKSLMEIQNEDTYIDLHNDYNCDQLEFLSSNKQLRIRFISINKKAKFATITIFFKHISFEKITITPEKSIDGITIDNFYRGRYEYNDGLKETSEDGRNFYYLEFYEGYFFELFAESITAIFS
jgi:hypothetical protein